MITQWLRSLNKDNVSDTDYYFVISMCADLCEERMNINPAKGFRWMIEKKRKPFTMATGKYKWFCWSLASIDRPSMEAQAHRLPKEIFDKLTYGKTYHRGWRDYINDELDIMLIDLATAASNT